MSDRISSDNSSKFGAASSQSRYEHGVVTTRDTSIEPESGDVGAPVENTSKIPFAVVLNGTTVSETARHDLHILQHDTFPAEYDGVATEGEDFRGKLRDSLSEITKLRADNDTLSRKAEQLRESVEASSLVEENWRKETKSMVEKCRSNVDTLCDEYERREILKDNQLKEARIELAALQEQQQDDAEAHLAAIDEILRERDYMDAKHVDEARIKDEVLKRAEEEIELLKRQLTAFESLIQDAEMLELQATVLPSRRTIESERAFKKYHIADENSDSLSDLSSNDEPLQPLIGAQDRLSASKDKILKKEIKPDAVVLNKASSSEGSITTPTKRPSKIVYSTRELFAAMPELALHIPNFDAEAKKAEIAKRPSRKQTFGNTLANIRKERGHYPHRARNKHLLKEFESSGKHNTQVMDETLCFIDNEFCVIPVVSMASSDPDDESQSNKPVQVSTRTEKAQRKYKRLMGWPKDPVPCLVEGKLAWRDGTRVSS